MIVVCLIGESTIVGDRFDGFCGGLVTVLRFGSVTLWNSGLR